MPSLSADRTFYLRTPPTVVTISAPATPAVVSWSNHGLQVNDPVVFSLPLSRKHCVVTSANPGVVTTQDNSGNSVAHGYTAGDPIQFSGTGTLPTNIVIGTIYYVIAAGLTANTFRFSATLNGAAVNTTAGAQVGFNFVWRATTLPAGVTEGTIYYVIAAGFTANAFEFSTSIAGSAVNTSGAASQLGPIWAQTGNDANNGLAPTRIGALLTMQAAWNLAVVFSAGVPWNFNGHTTTIQHADGTYTGTGGSFIVSDIAAGITWAGGGTLSWQGNTADQDAVKILGTGGGDTFQLRHQFQGFMTFNNMAAICPQYTFMNCFLFGPFGTPFPPNQPTFNYQNMSWSGNPGSDPYVFNQGQSLGNIDGEHRIFSGSNEVWMEWDGGGSISANSNTVVYFCNTPVFPSGLFELFTVANVTSFSNANYIGQISGPKCLVDDFGVFIEENNGVNNVIPGTAPVLGPTGVYEFIIVGNSPAWRRLLAQTEPEAELNRMAPIELVWHDPSEEEEAIVLELIRMM